jgi:anti-repressor protein
MTELIPLHNDSNGKKVVSARELHGFLGCKKDFSDWIKQRIEKYGFQEDNDFTTFQGKSTGGRPVIEYAISMNMAKELAMVEGNAKGKQARAYFIKCEETLKTSLKPLSHAEILLQQCQLIVEQERRIENVEERIDLIEAKLITSPDSHLAISGFASLYKIKIDHQTAQKAGRKAATICKVQGYLTGTAPDAKYGSVKTYPKEVLEDVFREMGLLGTPKAA